MENYLGRLKHGLQSLRTWKKGRHARNFDARIEGLELILDWLEDLIVYRLQSLTQRGQHPELEFPEFPQGSLQGFPEPLRNTPESRTLIACCLANAFRPNTFAAFARPGFQSQPYAQSAGGVIDSIHLTFRPTLRTVGFLLGGLFARKQAQTWMELRPDHPAFTLPVVKLKPQSHSAAHLDQLIELEGHWLSTFLAAQPITRFPEAIDEAGPIVPQSVLDNLLPLRSILEDPAHVPEAFRQGFRMILHGPSGSGKADLIRWIALETDQQILIGDLEELLPLSDQQLEQRLQHWQARLETGPSVLLLTGAHHLFDHQIAAAGVHQLRIQVVNWLQHIKRPIIFTADQLATLSLSFRQQAHLQVELPAPSALERLRFWMRWKPADLDFDPPELLDELAEKHALSGHQIRDILGLAALHAQAHRSTTLNSELIEPLLQQALIKAENVPFTSPDSKPC